MLASSKSVMDDTGEVFVLSDFYRLQARITLHKSGPKNAEIQLLKALEIARKQYAGLWDLRASVDLAKLWQKQNKVDKAIALLEPVHNSIDEGDCPDDQAIAQQLLVSLKSCSASL